MVDLVVALAGLVCLGVPMAVIAAAIWAEGGRPVIFTQIRVGRDGRRFRLYKFRKFHAGSVNGPKLTVHEDPRLTKVGRFIERTKLDELPQLWNVVRGDMSIVGPRPEVPAFADCFDHGWRRLLDFRPGIFGPAQVAFRNEGAMFRGEDIERFYRDVLFPAKARLDLSYYSHRSLTGDLAWICRGILAVAQLPGAAEASDQTRDIATDAVAALASQPSLQLRRQEASSEL
jgi:lipopolysaccharide/colanic/teichoic acid biosynthesis glycosyltransferase